jgi:hypothetical protein
VPVTDNGGNLSIDDGGNSITVDNGGTFAVQSTIAAGATNIAKAEDVASADADVGVPSMAVRKATPANTSGTDGDYEMLQMSAGRLWVDPSGVTLTVASHAVTNAGTFATQADTELTTADLDTGAGTDTRAVVGLAGAASGGAVLVQATAAGAVKADTTSLGGTAVDTNSGTKSAGTQRVVIATDQPSLTNSIPVSDNSGSLTVDAPVGTPVFVTATPSTSGGWSVANCTSGDTFTALTNAAQVIKGSAGTLGGWYIYNPNATAAYVNIYNIAAASVTVGTSTPTMNITIPATSAANLEMTNGVQFGTAISASATTTGGGSTAMGTALEANFFFK